MKEETEKTFADYCTSCGSCCKRVPASLLNVEKFATTYNIDIKNLTFPYDWDISGRCEMLDRNNKCKVYHNRPNMCNIEWMQKQINIEKNQFYKMNAIICNTLMEEDGVDESYRVKLI